MSYSILHVLRMKSEEVIIISSKSSAARSKFVCCGSVLSSGHFMVLSISFGEEH
jgi:hypothetical protein